MELKTARFYRKMTQINLFAATRIKQTRISQIENGWPPTENEKTLIARALGYQIDEIDWPKFAAPVFEKGGAK